MRRKWVSYCAANHFVRRCAHSSTPKLKKKDFHSSPRFWPISTLRTGTNRDSRRIYHCGECDQCIVPSQNFNFFLRTFKIFRNPKNYYFNSLEWANTAFPSGWGVSLSEFDLETSTISLKATVESSTFPSRRNTVKLSQSQNLLNPFYSLRRIRRRARCGRCGQRPRRSETQRLPRAPWSLERLQGQVPRFPADWSRKISLLL